MPAPLVLQPCLDDAFLRRRMPPLKWADDGAERLTLSQMDSVEDVMRHSRHVHASRQNMVCDCSHMAENRTWGFSSTGAGWRLLPPEEFTNHIYMNDLTIYHNI